MAMPEFANSAATTALVPPEVAKLGTVAEGTRLVNQHHRNVPPDRIGQLAAIADELFGVRIEEESRSTLGTNEDL